MNKIVLGIDATNIRSGGGLTHLKELLSSAEPASYGFEKVIIWSNQNTLEALPHREWLIKQTHPLLNKSFVYSFFFQICFLSNIARKKYKCDLLFVPGGTFFGRFKNFVTMSQNMLPFEKKERARYPKWQSKLRFRILYYTQKLTFKRAKGIVFLTNYAKNYITSSINLKNDSALIPHGINLEFTATPKPQLSIEDYSFEQPFRLLYVSIVTVYKHQWNVAEAILKLRAEGYPITLDLVGDSDSESLTHLNNVLKNDKEHIINYKGLIPYDELDNVYKTADSFIFASSCENMPIILIEAMTAGLPIASSNMGPMPEVLGQDAFFFDPLSTSEIYSAVKSMLESNELRRMRAENTYNKSINYTWESCSAKTFEYLSYIVKQNLWK